MKDYTHAKVYKSETEAKRSKAKKKPELEAERWWLSERCGEEMVAMAEKIEQNSNERHMANLRHARMYENVELNNLTGADASEMAVRQALLGAGLVSLNVVAAATDTLAAKIAKNHPYPKFLTSGGSWPSQQKARRLNKWATGMFYETKIYEKAARIFLDGCVFGTGLLHVFLNHDDGRLEVERVLPDEIFVDDNDATYGEPRQMFRRKLVSREVLTAMFPEHEEAIETATAPSDIDTSQRALDMVEVWEGWHLRSSAKSEDGIHCIAIEGCELLCEEWKVDAFPFVTFRFKPRVVGFWGKGTAESLMGIQLELNRLIRSISEQLRRKGKGRTFVAMGSKVVKAHLTNGIGDIVMYTGEKPTVDSSNAVSSEEFMQVDRLYAKAFQEVGVSELSAASKKPVGLDASVALREFSEIESERFALVHLAWERFFMDFCELAISLVRSQYGSAGYKIRLPNKRYVVEVDWKDINLDADSYTMQMFPVSSLPQTPSARYQRVKEMLADQMIDKPTAQRLLEFPDLEAEMNLGNAAIDDVDATISLILDEKVPKLMPVDPYQNLQLLVERGTAAYLYARHHDCDEERLEMLRQLISQATMGIQATLPPPPPAPMPMAPPMGAGAPPNVSMGDMSMTVNGAGPAPAVPPAVAM